MNNLNHLKSLLDKNTKKIYFFLFLLVEIKPFKELNIIFI